MFKIRLMQAFLVFLWLCLLIGIYRALQQKMYLPAVIGLCGNLFWQYMAVRGIRQQRLVLSGELPATGSLDRGRLRRLTIVSFCLMIPLLVNTALLVNGVISTVTFAWLALAFGALAIYVLTKQLSKLKQLQG